MSKISENADDDGQVKLGNSLHQITDNNVQAPIRVFDVESYKKYLSENMPPTPSTNLEIQKPVRIAYEKTIYRHALTGDHLSISSNYEYSGRKSEKIDKLLANQSIKKLIEDKILVKIGYHDLTPRNPPNPKLESGPGIIVQDFKHTLTGDIITLTPNFRFVGIKSEKIEKLLANQNLKELVHDGILVKHGTRRKIPTHKQPPLKSPLKGHATIERDSTKPIIDL